MQALIAGATGFVGGHLARHLRADGADVRCLVRNPTAASWLSDAGCTIHAGDVLFRETLVGAGKDVDIAYYLVHSMGRGNPKGFSEQESVAAEAFARMCTAEGVNRIVYLGGLGDRATSAHLRSRQHTAEVLSQHGPPLTYLRAGMVVGAGSESFKTLQYLVKRLPVMIAPAWLKTRTQPIGIDDVIAYLAAVPNVPKTAGREIQIGGADVVTYGDMLDYMSDALGKRRSPRIPVPFITPWLSSLWIGLVTPVDAGVARPLIEGLRTETVVTDPAGAALFGIEPESFTTSLTKAVSDAGLGRI